LKRLDKTRKIIWKQKTRGELRKIGYSFKVDDSSYIGKRFRKGNKTNGTIVAILSADRNDGENFWYFLHDDYDGEDFDLKDISTCIELKDKKKRKHNSSSSNKENDPNPNKVPKNEVDDDTDDSSDDAMKEYQVKYLDSDDHEFLPFF